MERRPDQNSVLKGIGVAEDRKPTIVLVGHHPRGYEVQVMTNEEGINQAWKYIDGDPKLKRISFREWRQPPWLKGAQEKEIELRKPST
jgi:hypothetical protein